MDIIMHILAMIGIFFIAKAFTNNLWETILICILFGVIKELYDLNSYGLFSIKDMISNFFGIFLGFTLDKYML